MTISLKTKLTALLTALAVVCPLSASEFELKDGDKVVWLGSTLIEREQRYGYWELALTSRWPDRNIAFRNLAWSGDNVFGEARLAFDINDPSLGLKRMTALTLAEKPTVIFICYGANESFDGPDGVTKFEKGLEKLLDELRPAKARIVLFSPTPFEGHGALKGWAEKRNKDLSLYRDVLRAVAERRKLEFADLFRTFGLSRIESGPPLTDNGMHLTEAGYQSTEGLFLSALNIKPLSESEALAGREKLRHLIVEKNRLYFYRWRPQNETYLFGFRKHEQGRNAKEVAEFDPLVSKVEEEIAKAKATAK